MKKFPDLYAVMDRENFLWVRILGKFRIFSRKGIDKRRRMWYNIVVDVRHTSDLRAWRNWQTR